MKKKVEIVFWCLCIAIAFGNCAIAEQSKKDLNETLRIDISRGIVLHVANDEASVTLRMSSLLKGNEAEPRATGRLKFKKDILKKIGMAMMMAPIVMQLMSLPGAIASIKMTLLRSILVGKIALAVLLYNALKNSQRSEVVLIHRPEYHEHYYHTYHEPEDDDEGWLGRRRKRHLFA